jgi:tetratricopeptide (TPR) repeat protein
LNAPSRGEGTALTDFFISYTRVDRPWAEWIASQLEAAGYTTVNQAWDFRPGGNFVLEMQQAAAESERTIAVLSPAYLKACLQSGFTAAEWAAAFARDPAGTQGLLLPVRIHDCEPRGLLRQIVYIDLVGLDAEAARDTLLAGVRRQRANPTSEPGFPGNSVCPGMEPPLFPSAIPHNIPFLGSGHFVGRQAALEALHRDLTRTDRGSIAVISGMGGVGKTELVVQYARQHLHYYPGGVCWLNTRTGDLSTQVIDYVQHTLMREVPQERGGQSLTLAQQLTWCWQTWQPPGRVLLVLDDVTELAPCRPILLAPPERFRLVLTTRQRGLEPSFAERPVKVLAMKAALGLLAGLAGAERVDAERAVAQDLCAWLGYLPLGLELVGRYLARDRGWSLAEMWDQLREAERPLEDASLAGDYPLMTAQRGVRAAFELSWQELDADAQRVARLLSLCAPAAVPWELAPQGMQQVQGPTYRIRNARRQLDNLHLVQPAEGRAEAVKLHPLIREFLQEKQGRAEDLKRALTRVMVEIAQGIAQRPTQETIQALVPMMPHLAEVAEQYTACLADDELLWPFVGLGRFYDGQGLYTLAEPWYALCLTKTQERFGAEHPDVATSLNNLAGLYRAQGRYSEVEPLYQNALEMRQRLLGTEHPDVATSLNNLALLYANQEQFEKAVPLLDQALRIVRQWLGDKHPSTQILEQNVEQVKAAMR